MYGAGVHIGHGRLTWATPDGRNAHQPLADAASPGQGRDVNGPIAVMNSANCFDQGCVQNGLALNLRFHPTALQGDGREKLALMTQTYFDNGGAEIQYNVVGSEIMKAAQEKPNDYKDLIVRVAGYSAYFVELPTLMQNDLISRNEHMAL
jgi:formate C-acetyltransferase